jgi:hypothetical protein
MCASSALPDELWAEILGLLPPSDLGRALCVSRSFASLSDEAWRASCYRRWPGWAALAEQAQWRRQFELLSLRESEVPADTEAIRKLQKNVGEGHRTILTSWLCEVRRASDPGSRPKRLHASFRPAAGIITLLPLQGQYKSSFQWARATFEPFPSSCPQVSFDWSLDSAIVHKAVAYLDCYLQQTNVEALGR